MSAASGRSVVRAILLAALAGCGGGGGSSPAASPPPPPVVTGPIWTQGVFPAAGALEDRCALVRTGLDARDRPFPDMPGSILEELFWLRSWTNQTYLWNTEVVDRNPADFISPTSYFEVLRTPLFTPSGQSKDRFHFSIPTADYLAQVISAPSAGYGAEFRIARATPPRDVFVLYTQTGTPAAELLAGAPKLARGARLLNVDGVDVVNGGATQAEIDILNNATFPRAPGETHTFTVRYSDSTQRSFTLISADIVETPVNRLAVLSTTTGNVGYILVNTFSPFSAEKGLVDAIAALKAQGVNDVVLDLRYNGGGLLAVASQLSYMLAGPARTAGKIFERLQFNAAAGSLDPVTGGPNTPTPFYSTGLGFSFPGGSPIQTLDLPRVYVLAGSTTCSATESVINGLRGVDVEVVLIGGTTCGKPFGFYPTDNCGQTYFTIQFQGRNNKNFGDYPDGFAAANSSSALAVKVPGCAVADDFRSELGDANERLLAAALGHRATGTCPAPSASSQTVARAPEDGLSIETSGRSQAADIQRNNRDLRRPDQDARQ